MSDDDDDDDDDGDEDLDGEDVEPVKIGRALELAWDGAFWCGDLRVPRIAKKPLYVEIEDEDGDLSPVRRKGLAWLVEHQAAVAKAMFAAIVKAYPAERAKFGADAAKMPPDLEGPRLKKHVTATNATVHDVVGGRLPYLGFECSCTWDREHGVGVMMHGRRVVRVGGADTAILEWIAEGDAKARKRKGKGNSKGKKPKPRKRTRRR